MNSSNLSQRDSVIWTAEEITHFQHIIVYDNTSGPYPFSRPDTRSTTTSSSANGSKKAPPSYATSQRKKREMMGSAHAHHENMLADGSMLRLIVLGAPGAGKTAILTRLTSGHFPHTTDPSTQRFQHGIRLDAQTYTIDAIEVSLDEAQRDRTLAHMIRRSDAAVIVYDAADPQTFRVACQLRDRVQNFVGGAVTSSLTSSPQEGGNSESAMRFYTVALVANKTDFEKRRRVVSRREGEGVAAAMAEAMATAASASSPPHSPTFKRGSHWTSAIPAVLSYGSSSSRIGPNGVLGRIQGPSGPSPSGPSCSFAEVSALSGDGISGLFFDVSRVILEQRVARAEDERQCAEAAEWAAREIREKTVRSSIDALLPSGGGKRRNFWKRISGSLPWRQAARVG